MTTDGIDNVDYIRAFMTERPVVFERSALVIVDMQNASGARSGALGRRMQKEGSTSTDYRFDRIETLVVPNIRRMLDGFRAKGGGILYVTLGAMRQDAADAPPHMRKMFLETNNWIGSDEHKVVAGLEPLPGELIVRKTSIGAFASTGIDHLMRSMGWDNLYMTGVSTNMCVETTAREAADRGYNVTMVEDSCASTRKELHEGTMENFQRLFGRVRSTDEVMSELSL
ncbi:MAG: cysteine hydrolase [Thalassobaculaceae bacterium]|nr:cysteine hydrolase [Thalassobaculaceae bacterium]